MMMQVSERIEVVHIQIEIAFAYDDSEKTTPPIECYLMMTILQWWQGAVEAISSAAGAWGNVGRLPFILEAGRYEQ